MKLSDYLSKEEIKAFTAKSDLRASWMVFFNWLSIAAIFALVATWTNVFTVLLGILLLGSRQLGLGILMHETGHRSLFKSKRTNEIVGQWMCAYPILSDMDNYAKYHREHHNKAGSQEDPDLPNYQTYPVSKSSFKRKIIRDFTGQTGLKLVGAIAKGAGDMMVKGNHQTSYLPKSLIVNVMMWAALYALGEGLLYLMWIAAYLTTYTFVARIRQIGEHGAVKDLFDPDPRIHTRTTLANSIERFIFCPNYVNYHAEHHFIASVPCYRLPKLHKTLVSKGFYEGYEFALSKGYLEALKEAVPELGKNKGLPA